MKFELKYKDNGLLKYRKENGEFIDVNIIDSFPLSSPGEFLSLTDDKGREVLYVENVNKLEIQNKEALICALKRRDFSFEITDLIKVEEQQELRCYFVNTKLGNRKVFTKLDEWPVMLENSYVKIEDIFGDIYLLKNMDLLSPKSRKTLNYFVE